MGGFGLDEDGFWEVGADDPVGLIDDFGNFQIDGDAAQAVGIDGAEVIGSGQVIDHFHGGISSGLE